MHNFRIFEACAKIPTQCTIPGRHPSLPPSPAVRSATVQNNLQSTRKSLGTAGFTFIGCKNTAFLKLRPVQSSIDNNHLSKSNEKSEAQKSYSDTLLRLSAVINDGKGAVAQTEVTSAKNKTAASVNIAVSPVRKMLDKAECDQYSVSHLLSPVLVRKEGEREKSPYEPDFTTTDRPVAQTHFTLFFS